MIAPAPSSRSATARPPTAKLAGAFLALVALLAAFAPWVTRHAYDEQSISERLQGPSEAHWLGTDILGRDLYSRIVFGARMSLAVGFVTALVSLVLGVAVGGTAGYLGGRVDRAVSIALDFLQTLPSVLLAILVMLLFGRGVTGLLFAISVTSWVPTARIARGLALQARELPHVEAARALGARETRILARHVVPALLGPVFVSLSFQVPSNILAESFLSFVGLGLEPPYSSWGTLAAEGFRAMTSYPHLIVFPGIALFLTLFAFSTLGDSLRDAVDPSSEVGRAPQTL